MSRLMYLSAKGVSKGMSVILNASAPFWFNLTSIVNPAKVVREISFSTIGCRGHLLEFGDPAGISNITFAPV